MPKHKKVSEIKTAPSDNIVNSWKWTNKDHLTYFQKRLHAMKTKKAPFETSFREYEAQETAISFRDSFWVLQLTPPVEQNLIEIYMGRTNGKISYDIIPDSETNIEELYPTKYALQFFLDGNEKDNFWKENKKFRNYKAKYGTGILFTGMRLYRDLRHKVKEDVEIQSGTDLLNDSNFEEYTNDTWFFFPKAIHPMDYYHDDTSYGSSDLQDAEDCIMKEKMSYKQFELNFWDNKAIDKKAYTRIQTGTDDAPKNRNDASVEQEEILIHYYYNRLTKDFYIVANEEEMLLATKYLYDDGKLPFVSAQHFPDVDCFWGRGIPHRIWYLKESKGNILQDIMEWAGMANSVNFITGADEQIGQDWSVWGRGVNVWRATGWADSVQQIQTKIDLGFFQSILAIIDDLIVQDTGDNPRAVLDSGTDKVGIVEMQEANKAVRQSTVDEGYSIALDEALTMTIQRIRDFAPSLMSEKIKDSDGKVIKTIFPKIKVTNARVEKKKWQITIIEDLGKMWYFDLEPWIVKWVGVKIQTASTSSVLPILERQRVTEYINNLTSLANISQFVPWVSKKLQEIDGESLMNWMWDSYGYDRNGLLVANSKRDKIRQQIQEKKKKLMEQSSLILSQAQNVPTNNEVPMSSTPTWVPAQGQGLQPTV